MQITPEQADDVFVALVSCGLDSKISTVSEISDGKNILYPEYKQYNFLTEQ